MHRQDLFVVARQAIACQGCGAGPFTHPGNYASRCQYFLSGELYHLGPSHKHPWADLVFLNPRSIIVENVPYLGTPTRDAPLRPLLTCQSDCNNLKLSISTSAPATPPARSFCSFLPCKTPAQAPLGQHISNNSIMIHYNQATLSRAVPIRSSSVFRPEVARRSSAMAGVAHECVCCC